MCYVDASTCEGNPNFRKETVVKKISVIGILVGAAVLCAAPYRFINLKTKACLCP